MILTFTSDSGTGNSMNFYEIVRQAILHNPSGGSRFVFAAMLRGEFVVADDWGSMQIKKLRRSAWAVVDPNIFGPRSLHALVLNHRMARYKFIVFAHTMFGPTDEAVERLLLQPYGEVIYADIDFDPENF